MPVSARICPDMPDLSETLPDCAELCRQLEKWIQEWTRGWGPQYQQALISFAAAIERFTTILPVYSSSGSACSFHPGSMQIDGAFSLEPNYSIAPSTPVRSAKKQGQHVNPYTKGRNAFTHERQKPNSVGLNCNFNYIIPTRTLQMNSLAELWYSQWMSHLSLAALSHIVTVAYIQSGDAMIFEAALSSIVQPDVNQATTFRVTQSLATGTTFVLLLDLPISHLYRMTGRCGLGWDDKQTANLCRCTDLKRNGAMAICSTFVFYVVK
ncbi:hypothetical protein DFH07DRAFT_771686 [Mycena maculata]|uniref:Uncharacterized protein n=1 Tax=Mycena maculata TaxID=230809 RepID=A0AAD7JCR3_9AGAR|nr:hypothetical protein DFH07DRAFT_771686 [Mycena maculata]